jgi:hypothetical protein
MPSKPPVKDPVKPSRKSGEEKKALSRAVQLRVILGKSRAEIAEEFRITQTEVAKRLKEARADGGARDLAENLVLTRLLPKAMAVFDAALEGEEDIPKFTIEVAKDVLFGSGVLKKKDEVAVTHNVSPLEAYRREREEKLLSPPAEVKVLPNGNYLEGELVDRPPLMLRDEMEPEEDSRELRRD